MSKNKRERVQKINRRINNLKVLRKQLQREIDNSEDKDKCRYAEAMDRTLKQRQRQMVLQKRELNINELLVSLTTEQANQLISKQNHRNNR